MYLCVLCEHVYECVVCTCVRMCVCVCVDVCDEDTFGGKGCEEGECIDPVEPVCICVCCVSMCMSVLCARVYVCVCVCVDVCDEDTFGGEGCEEGECIDPVEPVCICACCVSLCMSVLCARVYVCVCVDVCGHVLCVCMLSMITSVFSSSAFKL